MCGRDGAAIAAGAGRGTVACGEMVAAAAGDGTCRAGKVAGHVPRKVQGAEADGLRARMADTLRGLVAELAGLGVVFRTMWAFAHAEGLGFKRNRARQCAGPTGRCPQALAQEGAAGQQRSTPCLHG